MGGSQTAFDGDPAGTAVLAPRQAPVWRRPAVSPDPTIHTPLPMAMPTGVGQTLPGLCRLSIRPYRARRLPARPVNAALGRHPVDSRGPGVVWVPFLDAGTDDVGPRRHAKWEVSSLD